MNRDGWRVLMKGLSVLVGVAAFVGSLVWVMFALVLQGYASDPTGAWVISALFALAGIVLCGWPWLFWKPTSAAERQKP